VSRSALLGETGRIPVSGANEPAGRNTGGGTGKAERRRTQGAARRLRRQAQRCPVKVGGKESNDDGINVIQTVVWPSTVRSGARDSNEVPQLRGQRPVNPRRAEALLRIGCAGQLRSRRQPMKWVSSLQMESREPGRIQESGSPPDSVCRTARALRLRHRRRGPGNGDSGNWPTPDQSS
jgi:hypothetical protein